MKSLTLHRRFPRSMQALCALAILLLPLAAGCGGGGKSGPVPISSRGAGKLAAAVSFQGMKGLNSAAARAGLQTDAANEATINVSVTGYRTDGTAFEPVQTSITIDLSIGKGQTPVMTIPVGVNHLATAIAIYPDGSTETVKGIVPEIVEGEVAKSAVNARTTIIAETAILAAGAKEITLAQLSQSEIDEIAAIVDELFQKGVDYADMDPTAIAQPTLSISPTSATVLVGATQPFAAILTDAAGQMQSAAAVWTTAGGIGTISADGFFTATAAGLGTITATFEGQTATAQIAVIAAQLVSIAISPASATVISGETQPFAASGVDDAGATVSVQAQWSVAGGIGTVDSAGVFTGTIAGSGTVTATIGSLTSSADVVVEVGPAASLTITPLSASLIAGETQQFSAAAADASGNAVPISPTWNATGGIGTIDANGLFTATTAGQGAVAAAANGLTAEATVDVAAGQAATLTASPASAALTAGETQQFSVSVLDANGNAVAATPIWTVTGGVGTIGANGLFAATTPGQGAVVVSAAGLTTSAAVDVSAGALATLTVMPNPASVLSGSSLQFSAEGADALGNAVAVAPTWTVTGGVGTIDSNGIFTAATAGGGTVAATANGLTASANVTVSEGSLASIVIAPSTANVTAGSTQQFTVSATDVNGNPISVTPAWTLSGSTGAINGNGLFAATTVGSDAITATVGAISDTASVTVIAGALSTITIAPTSTSVVLGGAQQFTATGTDAYGNSAAISPAWTVAGGVGSINGTGLFTALTAGLGSVTAADGAVTGSASVSVSAGALAAIVVSPPTATVALSGTQQFTASGQDANGNAVAISPIWSVAGSVGSVNGNGMYASLTKGSETVTATDGAVSGTASVTTPNSAPTANAGADQSALTGETVSLDGTASSDPDAGDSLTYAWTQVSGAAVTLSNSAAAQPTFMPISAGAYVFSLTVNDGADASVADTVTATVSLNTTPTLTSVSPSNGANNAVTTITLTGTNFQSGATVDIGGIPATNVAFANSTSLTAEAPAGLTPGSYDVTVTNPDTQTAQLTSAFFATNPSGTNHAGTINATETWTAAGSPHIVTADVSFAWTCSGPTLTIEPGSVVKFDPGVKLNIGVTNCGKLIANGSTGAILFTSNAGSPAPGDWQGVEFGVNTQAGTLLDNVTIEYAGATTGAGITANTSNLQVQNSAIRNNSGIGVKFGSGYAPALFSANSLSGNTSYPVEIYGRHVINLPSGSLYSGNGVDAIKVMGDSLISTGTWSNPGVPYEIQGALALAGTCSGPTITIAAGTTLKFLAGTGFDIGVANCGTLIADGAAGAITFTSAEPVPAAGDWQGLKLGVNTQTNTVLNNVVIEYAGLTNNASLVVQTNLASITNSVMQNGLGVGVNFLDGGGGENAFTGNAITGHTMHPINIYGNYYASLLSGNTLTGNGDDTIYVEADSVLTAGTWANNGLPIQVKGALSILGSIGLAGNLSIELLGNLDVAGTCSGPTLTVGAGDTLKFAPGAALNIGVSNCGKLIADGTAGTITLTSNQAVPAAGDWQGVVFGVNTQSGTLLDSVVVEYGGATTGAGLTFNSSNPQIQNSSIQNNSAIGVKFADLQFPAAFTGNTITGNTSYPVEMYGNYVRTLPSGNSYVGNGKDAIKVMSDVLLNTGTWVEPGVPYEIQGDLTLAGTCSGPSLTIAAGSTLQFAPGTGFIIGTSNCGTLIADGTANPITFTSSSAAPAAGDWKGLEFGVNTQNSTLLDNVVVEYAGMNGASISVAANTATIANSLIQNGTGIGVNFADGGGGEGTFTGNTITTHTLHPINIFANYLSTLAAGNTLTGNGEDIVKVEADSISTTGTWANNGLPIQAQGALTFLGTNTFANNLEIEFLGNVSIAGTCSGPTLTVGAGDTLKFAPGTIMNVGVGNCGKLVANGTAGAIAFTSNQATPAAGDWQGIVFGVNTQTGTLLDNVKLEYAGNTTGAGITFNSSNPQIKNSFIQYNSGFGLLIADLQSPAAFTNNTVTGNTTYPLQIYGNYARTLPAGNFYVGNGTDALLIMGDTIANSGTWEYQGVPYRVQGDDIAVGGTCSGPALTIAPNVTVEFEAGLGLLVGVANCAKLIANGTLGPITFTSANPAPSAGDWAGIKFGINTQTGTTILNSVVSYGGGNGFGDIYLNSTGTNVTIQNNTISDSSAYGVYVDASSTFSAGDEATNSFGANASGNVFR